MRKQNNFKNHSFHSISIFFLFTLSILFWACRINQSEKVDYKLSFSNLFDSLKSHDEVIIITKSLNDVVLDTLFIGKVDVKSKIENLNAPNYHGGKIKIQIIASNGGKAVYQIKKVYDGSAEKTDSSIVQILIPTEIIKIDTTKIPIDTTKVPIDTLHRLPAPEISSVNASDGKVTVSWNAIAGADSYNIFYGEGALVDKVSTRIKGATSPFQVIGLKNGAIYSFSITAVNKVGESDLGSIKSATPQMGIPANPILGSTSAGDTHVTLSWVSVTGASAYNLYYKVGVTVDKSGTKIMDITTPYQVLTLVNGSEYAFGITAVNAGGESGLSNIATATPQAPAPGAPTFTSVNTSDASVTAIWSNVSGAISYNLYYKIGSSVDKNSNKISEVTSPSQVTGLTNGSLYAFAISVVSAGGESGISNIITGTPQVSAPSAPILGAVSAGDAKVTLTWSSVNGATSYSVYYLAGNTVDKSGTKIQSATSPLQITSLTNGSSYAFAVTAINPGGESGLSNIATGSPQVSAPASPILNSVTPGNGKVTIDWTAIPGATFYTIFYTNGAAVDTASPKISNVTSPAQITGLTNGSVYKFVVVAANAGGKSAVSNIGTATPELPSASNTLPTSKDCGIDTTGTYAVNNGYTPAYSFSLWPAATYFSLFQFNLSTYTAAGLKSATAHFNVYASGLGWAVGSVSLKAHIYRMQSSWIEGTGNWYWHSGSWQNGGDVVLANYPVSASIKSGSTSPLDTTTGLVNRNHTITRLSNLTFVDTQTIVLNLKAGNIAPPPPSTIPLPANWIDLSMDFFKYVNPILSGSVIDYGFVIFFEGIPAGNYLTYPTKELGDGSYGPKLILTYFQL